MARTIYPQKNVFIPVNCGRLAFEEISLDEAIKGLKKAEFKNVKVKKLEIKELEAVNITESLLEDFSKTNLSNEMLDLSTATPRNRNRKSKRKDIVIPEMRETITEILDTDIMELLKTDITTPLQDAFDNIISMISVNKG